MEVGQLTARLTLNMQDFQSKLKQAQQNFQQTASKLNATAGKMRDVGGRMSTYFTTAIAGGLVAITEGTREFRTELAKLETNAQQTGTNMDVVNQKMREAVAVTGEVDSSVEALSNVMATEFAKDGDKFRAIMDELIGASIKFKDTLKLEGIADGLQETLAVGEAVGPFAELIERLGINLDDFNAGLQEAIENGTQQQYVLDTLAKHGLADTYEAYKKNNEELIKSQQAHYDMQKALADLGKTLEPIATQIVNKVTDMVNWFNELDNSTKKTILTIAGIAAIAGPVIVGIGMVADGVSKAIGAFKNLTGIVSKLPKIFSIMTPPGGLIILAIAAVATAAYLLINNWDKIKAKAVELKDKLVEVWEKIKAKTTEIWDNIKKQLTQNWEDIKDTAEKIWNTIKDFFKKWGDEILLLAAGPAGWAVLLGRKLTQNWGSIKQAAINAWNNIKSGISNIWSNITSAVSSAVSNVYSTVKSKLENLWSYIRSIPSQARRWGSDIIRGLVNGIKSIHIPMPHFDFSVDWKEVAGVSFPVPDVDVDWYAKGGVFTKPVLAGFGDVDEAIVPFEGPHARRIASLIAREMPSQGTGSQIVVQNMYVRNDDDIHRIARELYKLQQGRLRGQGR